MADVTESLSSGFQNGYNWEVDHDETTGTITVTVTGTNPQPGDLELHGDVAQYTNGDITGVLFTFPQQRIDGFVNQGPQQLFQHNQLIGVTLLPPPVKNYTGRGLQIWTTFVHA